MRGRQAGVHREGSGGGGKLGDEESKEKGAFRSLGRKKATKTAARSARAAVLRQNQKVSATACNSSSLSLTPDRCVGACTWARQPSPCTYMQCNMWVWEGSEGR